MAWLIVKEFTGQKNTTNNIEILNDNILYTDPNSNPNKILNQIKSNNANNNFHSYNERDFNINNSMGLIPFTEQEILNIVKIKIKNKWSSGPDDIPAILLKESIQCIITPLTHLINASFETGEFPNLLKTSKVIPLHKKNNKNDLENYRPLSLNSVFSKVFEYCVLDRLLKYLERNNILCQQQHGFVSGKSTTTAVFDCISQIVDCLEAGECPAGIFCDLSRAFDCVQHSILLERMFKYGIRGIILDWFKSFLGDRQQYVQIGYKHGNTFLQVRSEVCDVRVGVPQGSILGPVLFLLFVNPLPQNIKYNLTMYADDTSALVSGNSNRIVEEEANHALASLDLWFRNNSLFLNTHKTYYMRFSTYQNHNNLDISVGCNDVSLTEKNSIKFLGLEIDKNLRWNSHCSQLATKISKYCFLIKNLKTVLDESQLVSFYYAQIYSRLLYGIRFWGLSPHAHEVFLCQKRIVRAMVGAGRLDSCKPWFSKLKILPLICIFILDVCTFVHENRHKNLKHSDIHSYDTRNKNQMYPNSHRLNITKSLPQNIGIKIYNHLPIDIKESESLKCFKGKLKCFLSINCFYTLDEFLDF